MEVIIEKDNTIRHTETLALLGHWISVDNSIYYMLLNINSQNLKP